MKNMQYLILHTESLTIETSEPRQRLQKVLDSVPARVQEAKRVMKAIRQEFIRAERLETSIAVASSSARQAHKRPVLVDLSVLLGEQWHLAERFKTFINPRNDHLSLNLLPLSVTLDLSSQILGLTLQKQAHRSHRITGGMGIGKSHAALLVLIDVLAKLDHAGFWIAFNPLDCIDCGTDLGKERLVEQLVVLLHRFDNQELLDILAPFYGERSYHTPQEFIGKVLLACRRFCEKQGTRFIHIIDQENMLYRQDRKPLTASFADDLLAGIYSDLSIYISSATSSEIMEYFTSKSVYFALHEVTRDIVQTGNNTAGLFYMFRDHSFLPANQRKNLLAWQSHFGGEWEFIKAIDGHARGCPLEADAILRYFSIDPLSPHNQDNPWSDFFDSSSIFEDDHYLFMSTALSSQSRFPYKKAYALLMRTLDYHITAEPEKAAAAGVWLWDRLAVLRSHDKTEALKYLRGLVDSRFMSIEVDKTPAAFTTRAAITLRSLPNTMYMDEHVVHYLRTESLNLPPILQDLASSLNSVKGNVLEDRIRGIFTDFFCLKIDSIKSSSSDRFASFIDGLEIRLNQRVRIFLKYLARDMGFIFSAPRRENGPGVWKLLIPEHNFFPMIDFAMLFIPSNEDPPVLFPIQVACNICSHEPSDKGFADGIIKKTKELYLHPLMTTFAAETQGKGRVQFIWIGQDNEDLERASSLEKFDNRSWFTMATNWTGLPETFLDPVPMPSLASIGYSCGDAVAAAYASLPARLQELELKGL